MFTVQWQAALKLQPRPSSMDSNAPRGISPGTDSTVFTSADQVTMGLTKNSYSSPSAVKYPFSSATHSCKRPWDCMRNFPISASLRKGARIQIGLRSFLLSPNEKNQARMNLHGQPLVDNM